AEAVYCYESGYISHSAKKDYGPLVVCLGILYGLKAIKETSVVFPFFMASLAIIRKALKCMFTEEELKQLDSLPGDDDEEVEASKPGADLVNLEGQDETSKKEEMSI
ncbi:SLC4A4, partial [Symbiodinium sp. KB8]